MLHSMLRSYRMQNPALYPGFEHQAQDLKSRMHQIYSDDDDDDERVLKELRWVK